MGNNEIVRRNKTTLLCGAPFMNVRKIEELASFQWNSQKVSSTSFILNLSINEFYIYNIYIYIYMYIYIIYMNEKPVCVCVTQ